MSLKKLLRSPRAQFTLPLLQSFNVAAICALGIWHGYLFRVEHQAPSAHELPLVSVESCRQGARMGSAGQASCAERME